ncbi:MAG: STAS domain-containing protein [Porticoccaceae bacterium]
MGKCKILVGQCDGVYLIRMEGDVRLTLCASLNRYIDGIFNDKQARNVLVDLLDAKGVDSTTLGLLAKMALFSAQRFEVKPTLFCTDETILRTLEAMSLDGLFDIIRSRPPALAGVVELRCTDTDEEEIRQQVLAAHKLLIKINPACEGEFIDLISTLEDQAGS